MQSQRDKLARLSKDELLDLITAYSKSAVALDGVWFQAVESRWGMNAAMECDIDAWTRFSPIEATRIKQTLHLPEHGGLEALQQALAFKFSSIANNVEMKIVDGKLIFRVVDCRIQVARKRKEMGLHPCKSVGSIEYAGFAAAIDSRITCTCLSCYPQITDDSVCCAWQFSLAE